MNQAFHNSITEFFRIHVTGQDPVCEHLMSAYSAALAEAERQGPLGERRELIGS